LDIDGNEDSRVDVGGGADPHVFLSGEYLYSPQQGNDKVVIYEQDDLEEVQAIPVDNAHGVCSSTDGSVIYTTDLNGAFELIAIAGEPGNAAVTSFDSIEEPGVAHNCAATKAGNVFVTHSGPAGTVVSLFTTKRNGRKVTYKEALPTGANPFGIAIYEGCIDM